MDVVTAGGVDIPALGVGTWRMTGRECRRAVETALDLGYRHVDTARAYGNEAAVGDAIAAAAVPREEVFVVTKVPRGELGPDDLRAAAAESAARLGGHIDLLLLHEPSPAVPVEASLRAMAELGEAGTIRHAGVSNFPVPDLVRAVECGAVPVVANQVACNPYHRPSGLLETCRDHDVAFVAHTPLAEGRAADDETLAEIGERYGKSAAQVALRWLLDRGVAAIPKASDEAHLRENAAVFDFELAPAERARIDGLARMR